MNEPLVGCPAACSGCDVLSPPRPLGATPPGWKRGETIHTATFTGRGRYFCEGCWTAVRQGERVVGDG